jgi:hypothetical protein
VWTRYPATLGETAALFGHEKLPAAVIKLLEEEKILLF